jgi:hypothetical protein
MVLQVYQLDEETFAAIGRGKTLRFGVQDCLGHVKLHVYISDVNIVYYENNCQLVR